MTPEPNALFGDAPVREPQGWHVSHLGVDYPGEVIVAEEWREEWGNPMQGECYFRVVLLLEALEVAEERLRDPRIGVCLPETRALEEAGRLGEERRTLRETQATYLASPSPERLRLGQALEEHQQQVGQRARQAYLQALAQGSVVTAQGRARVQEILGEPETVEELVGGLAAWLLAAVYPSLPLDPSGFPSPLTPDHVAILYAGLTGQREDPEARTVAQTFGPGLGLCERDAPLTLTAPLCPTMSLVRQALEEGGGRVVVGPLLRRLAHERGLGYPLASLVLLLHLFSSEEDLELTLVPGHPLRLVDGTPLTGDVLFRELLPEMAWPADLREWVRVLGPGTDTPPTWRSALPWIAVFLPQAGAFLGPQEEAAQERLLMQRLEETSEGLREAVAAIEGLAELMGVPPPEALQGLQPLEEVCRAPGLQNFLAVARSAVGGPLALRRVVDAYLRAHHLSEIAPRVHHAYTYLQECSAIGESQGLDLQRLALVAQYDLSGLLQNPSLGDSLQIQFDSFQRQYAAAHARRHQEYQGQLASLRARLTLVEAQARALEQLNTLAELGSPLGADLPLQVRELLASLELCPASPDALDLEAHPFCTACHLRPSDQPPTQEAEGLARGVQEALQGQNRRLSSAAIQRILARPDEPLTDQFVKVVQSSDLAALAQVLDAPVMEFLRRFLREA